MLLPQQGQQDRGYLDHEQQYAQPSDHLAYRFWVPHKETDVGEEKAHGHVVDAGRELPTQDARDPRQPYCDEHRRRGPCVVPAQPRGCYELAQEWRTKAGNWGPTENRTNRGIRISMRFFSQVHNTL